jgi:DNA-directed RNA polymerase specialized sigma24 family protein
MEMLDRIEKYQRERDAKHGVATVSDVGGFPNPSGEYTGALAETRLIFWDCLNATDREGGLYLVLRFCLGYSMTEIALNMDVSRNRVKYKIKCALRECESRARASGIAASSRA